MKKNIPIPSPQCYNFPKVIPDAPLPEGEGVGHKPWERHYLDEGCLIICFLVLFGFYAHAMGGKPPAKEEPKYKLEILKVEIVNAPGTTPEAKTSVPVKKR